MLLTHVSGTRPQATVQVATAVKTFTPLTIQRAVYGTGWGSTVVLEADIGGVWKASAVVPSGLVNINTASADELSTLPMIGHVRARAIVRDRTDRGPFATIEDLRRVQGIGPATISAIRNLVTTGT
jgi:competence protein ComEA